MPHIIPVMTIPSDGPAPDVTTGSIFFIGNATVLIRYAGFTILTDPTFIHQHEQVLLGYGLQTTRLTNPAVDSSALPPLDLIVLLHFHGDPFDQVAERELEKALPIVTMPEAAHALRPRGFGNSYSLDPLGVDARGEGERAPPDHRHAWPTWAATRRLWCY
jgi:L-ascorbate metabolism protein UlaG (beta-lactamase superfamily)